MHPNLRGQPAEPMPTPELPRQTLVCLADGIYSCVVDHIDAGERLAHLLDALRSIVEPDDPTWQPGSADARAVMEDGWATLADALAEKPAAAAILAAMRDVARSDAALLRSRETSRRLGAVLDQLESASCHIPELMELAPRLVPELGFDRAIFSRIVDGLWVSQSVCVPDDPQWAAEINRAGQEQPQPLVPGLHETEIVRRREARMVRDVQHDSRVHRPIADASRSTSYVAAPVLAGGRVVALLHGDRYRQGRDTDDSDCDLLACYAKGLAFAFSRARAVDQLGTLSAMMQSAVDDCRETTSAPQEFTLDSGGDQRSDGAVTARAARSAVRGVRDALTAREAQILEHMAQGRTNSAIAAKLFIAEGTVKQHVKRILRKLGAENRVEAVSLLYQSDRN